MKHKNGTNLEVKTAELIPSYKFDAICIETDNYEKTPERIWSDCCRKQGGFNPYTRQFTPLKYASEGLAVCDALDAITAAVEAGIVDRNDWSNQLFASETDFEAFLEELEYYDETNRSPTAGGGRSPPLSIRVVRKASSLQARWRRLCATRSKG